MKENILNFDKKMKSLKKTFENDEELLSYVKNISPWCSQQKIKKTFCANEKDLLKRLKNLDVVSYSQTRNFLDGHVSKLSPYIEHGLVTLTALYQNLKKEDRLSSGFKFIQELVWREFWSKFAQDNPDFLWESVENYKTGYEEEEYSKEIPRDIQSGTTGVACLDFFIETLYETGYLHNHARMYLSSYLVHWRRVKWQVGAKWFLTHLIDGNLASNNFSWQWIASTFSNKPYIFNLDNIKKYQNKELNTNPKDNEPLNFSYDELRKKLFPRLI
jgi:deoxyribodipyrimidine photo-lyase